MTPLVYRVSEVCDLLGFSRSKAQRMIAAGEMPVLRYGRVIRVPRWWVMDELERSKAA